MKLPILASLSLSFLIGLSAPAQTADDFFHGGALSFLSNNIPTALEVVTNGLQRFPEDQKLQKLHELLNQQQQQQQQQDQQEQKEKDEQQQEQEKKDEQQKDQNQQQKEDQKKPEDQKSGDQSKPQPEEKKDSGEPQEVAPQTMTPQEAKQLLDAQKDDEQVLIFPPQGEPKQRTKQLKDW
jgi:hypothetical protein